MCRPIHNSRESTLLTSITNFIKSFGVRTLPVLESANINFKNIDKTFTPNVPAWCINKPKLIFDLHSGKKSETSPIIMKSNFQELKSHYMEYEHIYTDGSKRGYESRMRSNI